MIFSKLKLFVISFGVFLQAGCPATLESSPETSRLCEILDNNGWSGSGSRKEGGANYSFDVNDGFAWVVEGPIKAVYWIEITGYTAGKAVGAPIPPMIYNPAEAELELAEKKIKALPKAWVSGQVKGQYMPTNEVPVPINLNGVEENSPSSFFIAFPIEITDPKTEYIFRPGTILLGGVRYLLPVYKSCYTPSRWWWYPIT